MSDTPLLELEGISKFYGNIIALQGVTTEVRAGQVTCVLGDNGAGNCPREPIGKRPYFRPDLSD